MVGLLLDILRATRNALFEYFLAFSHSKNFKFACYLGEIHLRIALNLLKHALYWTSGRGREGPMN